MASPLIVSPGLLVGREVPDDGGTGLSTPGTEREPRGSGPLDTLDDRFGASYDHEPVDDYLSTDYASEEVKDHRTCIVQVVSEIRSRSMTRERRVSKIA
jgi:hypothetical protein